MYALKTPSFLKPISRPSSPSPAPSPRPDSAPAPDRLARPTSKLSFSNFKRTASPLTLPVAPLVHDGSCDRWPAHKDSKGWDRWFNESTWWCMANAVAGFDWMSVRYAAWTAVFIHNFRLGQRFGALTSKSKSRRFEPRVKAMITPTLTRAEILMLVYLAQ